MTLKSNCRWCEHLVNLAPPRAKYVGGCEFGLTSENCNGKFELSAIYKGNDPRPKQQFEEWHCSSEADRKLADIMVELLSPQVWEKLAKHFGTEYPHHIEDQYHLIYKMFGCK